MPRVVLEYTVTLWACKAHRWATTVQGLVALLLPVGWSNHPVVDLLKERVLGVQKLKVEMRWCLRRTT